MSEKISIGGVREKKKKEKKSAKQSGPHGGLPGGEKQAVEIGRSRLTEGAIPLAEKICK